MNAVELLLTAASIQIIRGALERPYKRLYKTVFDAAWSVAGHDGRDVALATFWRAAA